MGAIDATWSGIQFVSRLQHRHRADAP
jgi:hypothetical protein